MTAPFTRAQAIGKAEAIASQMSGYRGESSPLSGEELARERVEIMDQYDSRWQRDPGRPAGPFS